MEKETFAYFKRIHHKAYARSYAHEKEWESQMQREWESIKDDDKEAYLTRVQKIERDGRGSSILEEVIMGRDPFEHTASKKI